MQEFFCFISLNYFFGGVQVIYFVHKNRGKELEANYTVEVCAAVAVSAAVAALAAAAALAALPSDTCVHKKSRLKHLTADKWK